MLSLLWILAAISSVAVALDFGFEADTVRGAIGRSLVVFGVLCMTGGLLCL